MIGELYYKFVSRPRAQVLRDHLVEMIPPAAKILDVGCGDGLLASSILEKRPDVSLSGIDILVQPHAQISVGLYDGKLIPYPEHSFDAVLFVDVLHHTEDPLALLREGGRVSRDCIIVKDHNRNSLAAAAVLRFMDWMGNSRHGIALPYNYWAKQRWLSTFAELGFTITEYRQNLGLYPPPVKWIFDGSLHFISQLRVNGMSAVVPTRVGVDRG
jgi:SAM-dependent methyltransferase